MSSSKKILAVMALTMSNDKLLIGSFCNIAKYDAIDFFKDLVQYAINNVAKPYGLNTI